MGEKSNKLKLTNTAVQKISVESGRVEFWDVELRGFSLRVSPGRKMYQVLKKVHGKLQRVTIGDAAAIPAELARQRAAKIISDMYDGKHINEERRAEQRKGVTLGKTMEEYFTARTNLAKRTREDYEITIKKYLSDWIKKPLETINEEMVSTRHLKIGKESGKTTANKTFRYFRALYNFAKGKDKRLPDNPAKQLSSNKQWFNEKRRNNLIKDHELPAWYEAADSLDNPYFKNYFKLLLFTGLRRNEALKLKWENVDFEERTFTAHETKNGNPHTLPMTETIEEIFRELATLRQNEWVFPGKTGHLKDPRRATQIIIDKSGIQFSPHDLRRTFSTLAENLFQGGGMITKRLLNHISNDVTDGYIHLSIEDLRRHMGMMTAAIMQKCEPKENVIDLQERKAQ